MLKFTDKRSLAEVINTYGPAATKKLKPLFDNAGIPYPPHKLALIGFKDTKLLELWAAAKNSNYQLITHYPIQAASGKLGPKLREGDKQVPEGVYKIIGFNPNSAYHLSMKLNYPNAFDLKHAKAEGRNEPGSNIFIHGHAVSVGCLAMGDSVIELLFVLAETVGRENIKVIIAPTDPSRQNLVVPKGAPDWTAELYRQISREYSTINKKAPLPNDSEANTQTMKPYIQ